VSISDVSKLLLSERGIGIAGVLLVLTVAASAGLARRVVGLAEASETVAGAALPGIVQPGDVGSIIAPTAITIAEVLTTIGDELTTGQPIARVDHSERLGELDRLNLEVERARREVLERTTSVEWTEHAVQRLARDAADAGARLASAERAVQRVPLRQAKDSPERAGIAYERARSTLRRLEQLAAAGLVPRESVENAEFEVQAAADDLANARIAAEAAARVQAEEEIEARARQHLALADQRRQLTDAQAGLRAAELNLKQAELTYGIARQAVADTFVRAPRSGAVLELPVHPGDRLAAGSLVARIAALDPLTVDLDVPPRVVNKLNAGDRALVDVPAIRLSGREARISSIAPLPGDAGSYSIRLTLPNPTRDRLAGQTAYVTLFTGREPGGK
jgi:multidrug resistance efflux pump